jgi:hypothetical protein
MKLAKFQIGDKVRPRPEWRDDPNNVPTGRVRAIEPFGSDGALHVGDERRAFAGYVFEPDYDAADDFAKSIDECYRAVRERKAAGGRGWPE